MMKGGAFPRTFLIILDKSVADRWFVGVYRARSTAKRFIGQTDKWKRYEQQQLRQILKRSLRRLARLVDVPFVPRPCGWAARKYTTCQRSAICMDEWSKLWILWGLQGLRCRIICAV